jgi:cysteine synthase A
MEGIGDGFVPRNLDLSHLTGIITTGSDESIKMAQRLVREEGIFCGYHLAQRACRNQSREEVL